MRFNDSARDRVLFVYIFIHPFYIEPVPRGVNYNSTGFLRAFFCIFRAAKLQTRSVIVANKSFVNKLPWNEQNKKLKIVAEKFLQ